MPVVRSCSRCLGASAKRTPSPTVTDGRGQPTVHTLNRYGAAEKVQDAAGTTLTTWDLTHFQPASVTDALGRVSTFGYDDYGNKTSETIAGSVTRSWTFKPTTDFGVPIKNRAAAFTDARGIEETYSYLCPCQPQILLERDRVKGVRPGVGA